MENRFGFKDLVFSLLLVSVIVLVALSMKQFDRQYQTVVHLEQQSESQLRELVAIHNALDRGLSFSATTQSSNDQTQAVADAFPEEVKLKREGKYDSGDWFVMNFGSPTAKLTPLLGADLYSYIVFGRTMETLMYIDPNTLDYTPLLATSWTQTDTSKAWQEYVDRRKPVPLTQDEIVKESDCPPPEKTDDRAKYIASRLKEGRRDSDIGGEADCPPAQLIDFKLRRGVTFSDGVPFTADDVVFTYDWIQNPKVDCPRDRQGLDRVKSCEKVNDYEVVFKMKEPYYQSFVALGGIWIMPKHFYGAYTPEQFNNSVGLLMGTGPYRLASPTDWKPGPGKIELLRNERYWGITPSFDRLVFYQIESDAASLVMFGNGELDMIPMSPLPYTLALKNEKIMAHSQNMDYSSPLSGYFFIEWNELRDGKPTMFADKRVRQAMTMLINREQLCKDIYLGFADPAPGPFHPLTKMHDPTLVDWKYDPDRAKALLKDVGYEDRGKGVLEKADGSQFSFKLTYPSKNETVDHVMQFVRDNLARSGINAELDPVDWTIIDEREKGRTYDALFRGWGAGSLEDDPHQMFDSTQVQDQGDNSMSYSSPEFDRISRLARRTLDDAKRLELWHQCERILHEDQPYTFMTVNRSLKLFDKRLANVRQARTGMNLVVDWSMPIPWYVPMGMQKYKQ
ncbi:MAG: ABC transporter substrate-binding protein [Planctomycetota bacterium]|nr:ABC transporter substrate-binding protein [Planctomycetota bacterium]